MSPSSRIIVDPADAGAYPYRSDTEVSALSAKAAGRLGCIALNPAPGPGEWRRACRRFALILLCAGSLAACGAHTPEAELRLSPPIIQAPKSAEKDGVRVAASILSDEEAQRSFGVDLASRDLQAVWVRIENGSPSRLWFLVAALDADYYTPNEVAFLFGNSLSSKDRARLTTFLRDHSPRQAIKPGESTEGFVLAKRTEGGRYVNIELAGHDKLLHFGFAIPVADGYFDFEGLAPTLIYDEFERPDLGDSELRAALRDLPCCTSDSNGERQGDPLNIAIVGNFDELMTALARSGWSFTHRITPSTIGRLIRATLAGQPYRVAPVSSLYIIDRPQDIALQRARSLISQRNHMRLWLAPFRYRGRSVWIGQVSRDIGVKATAQSPSLTTHVIDPYVDEAREYLLQTLLHHHSVSRFGFVAGVGSTTPEQPRTNLTGDPYFTDGLRLLVVLSEQPTPPHRARNFHWQELDLGESEEQPRTIEIAFPDDAGP